MVVFGGIINTLLIGNMQQDVNQNYYYYYYYYYYLLTYLLTY